MREIKFRAWDKEKMIYSNDVYPKSAYKFEFDCLSDYKFKLVKMVDRYNVVDNEGNEIYQEVFESVGANVMQYTGTVDVTGAEVYEGDIVKYHDLMSGEYKIGEVIFCHGSFCVRGYLVGRKTVEIIGNIYENPELLEVE